MAPFDLTAEVRDLNALITPRRKVRFGDVTYEVPGDMPMDIHLLMEYSMQEDTTDVETVRSLRQCLVDLLSWYTPDNQAVKDKITQDARELGVRTIFLLLNAVYAVKADDEAEERAEGNDSSPQVSTTEVATPTTTGNSSSEPSPTPNSETVDLTTVGTGSA